MTIDIQIQDSPLALPETHDSNSGAVVRFAGVIRSTEDGLPIAGLAYEAYRPMAENQIRRILFELGDEYPFNSAWVRHRTGFVPVGEPAILIEIRAAHRAGAFAVASKFMDRLKMDVPIWKRVIRSDAKAETRMAIPTRGKPTPDRLVEIEELWAEIDDRTVVLPVKESRVIDAIGEIVADRVAAQSDSPAFDHSSMDGFCFDRSLPGLCRIVGQAAAGEPTPAVPGEGETVRIFTGAVVPSGTFAVARQEDCIFDNGCVRVMDGVELRAGENIRRRGDVFKTGDPIFEAGVVVNAGVLAILASLGIEVIATIRKPTVLHMVTGDELVSPGSTLKAGQIFDSNRPMVAAVLRQLGCDVQSMHLRDDPVTIKEAVDGCEDDILLISGGSGPGDRDHTAGALVSAGYEIHVSRLNSRPGKPLIYATRGGQIAFGLPGNPLSHWVCLQAFVRRAIFRMSGRGAPEMTAAFLRYPIADRGDGRRTWTPGVSSIHDGCAAVTPLPWKHSGDLSPLVAANCLILDASTTPDGKVQTLQL